jgi:hypothetical protein
LNSNGIDYDLLVALAKRLMLARALVENSIENGIVGSGANHH